jgi:MinD superfamily P-loop ATPase
LKPKIEDIKQVTIPVPSVDETKCTYCGKCSEVCEFHSIVVLKNKVLIFPELCHGCGGCSALCPAEAISEIDRGIGVVEIGKADNLEFISGRLNIGEPMPVPVIREVKKLIDSDKINIIDSSPGTSCPVVSAVKDSNFCILVTEPTPFGLNDLKLAVEVLRKLNIPFGVVINQSDIGDEKVEGYCKIENIPVLLRIPFDKRIAVAYSKGIPLIEELPEYKEKFLNLYEEVRKQCIM